MLGVIDVTARYISPRLWPYPTKHVEGREARDRAPATATRDLLHGPQKGVKVVCCLVSRCLEVADPMLR